MEEIMMLPTSTQIRMMKLFRNARPMSACCQAVIKLSKLSQLRGRSMTLVFAYSSSVLKAVKMQDTMGTRATKAAKIKKAYLITFRTRRLAFSAAISFMVRPPYFLTLTGRSARLFSQRSTPFWTQVTIMIRASSTTAMAEARPTFWSVWAILSMMTK